MPGIDREPLTPPAPPAAADAPPGRRPLVGPWVGTGVLVVGVVFLLDHAQALLLPITVALVFAFVLAPPVRALAVRGLPTYLGAGLVVAAALGVVVLIGALVAAPAAAWWARAPEIVQALLEAVQRWRDAVFPYATPAALARDGETAGIAERLATEGWTFTRLAIGETLSFAVSASATVILLFFLLASEQWLLARTVAAIPNRRTRARVLAALQEAGRDISLFIGAMGIINAALGLATGLALWWIGLPNPVLWGVTAAVLAFIPYLGPLVIALLLLAAGSVAFGTGAAMLGPPLAFLLLHGVEANFLSPVFMGHRLRMPALFVFLSVLVWGWLWGVAGTFIAVPMLLALRAAARRFRRFKPIAVYLHP